MTQSNSAQLVGWSGESGWCNGHHPRLLPLRPGFDPGLVRGLWLVHLNLTPRVFLRVLWFSFLSKNQLSRQNLCRWAYWSWASDSRDWEASNVVMLNKPFVGLIFITRGCEKGGWCVFWCVPDKPSAKAELWDFVTSLVNADHHSCIIDKSGCCYYFFISSTSSVRRKNNSFCEDQGQDGGKVRFILSGTVMKSKVSCVWGC